MKKIDLSGQKFGMLTVVNQAESLKFPSGQIRIIWHCRCDCGGETQISGGHLRSGHTTSCGCLHPKSWHGLSKTKLYGVWEAMIQRTTNPNCKTFHHYGGRGINCSESWKDFQNFYQDMAESYSDGLTLERTDNNVGYSKENCRWATRTEQSLNRRSNRYLTFQGKRMTVFEWAKEIGINSRTLIFRLNSGWPDDVALTHPLVKNGNHRPKIPS